MEQRSLPPLMNYCLLDCHGLQYPSNLTYKHSHYSLYRHWNLLSWREVYRWQFLAQAIIKINIIYNLFNSFFLLNFTSQFSEGMRINFTNFTCLSEFRIINILIYHLYYWFIIIDSLLFRQLNLLILFIWISLSEFICSKHKLRSSIINRWSSITLFFVLWHFLYHLVPY